MAGLIDGRNNTVMSGGIMKPVTAFTAFVFFAIMLVLVLKNPNSTNAVVAAPVGLAVGVAQALTGPSKNTKAA